MYNLILSYNFHIEILQGCISKKKAKYVKNLLYKTSSSKPANEWKEITNNFA